MAFWRPGLGVVLLLLAACADAPRPPAEGPVANAPARVDVAPPPVAASDAEPVAVHVSQAEQARAVLEQACGLCHIGGSSQAPAALGIFDLTEPDWTAKMTDEALEGFVARLEDQGIAQDEADIVIGHVSRVLSDRRAEQLAAPDC